jgi:hypothetical protein
MKKKKRLFTDNLNIHKEPWLGLESGSSGGVPAQQVWGPKSQYCQKKKKKKKTALTNIF